MLNIALILCLFSFSALAKFTVPTETSDDSVVVSGSAHAGVKWVWIKVVFQETEEDTVIEVPPEVPTIAHKVWLRHGPGKYTITINTSTSPQKTSEFIVGPSFIVTNTDLQNGEDLLPTDNIQSDDPEIKSLAQEITRDLKSETNKARAIHDWVTSHIAYDVEMYLSGSYVTADLDALTILHQRKAVCEGYANLTAALNRAAGLASKFIHGEGIQGNEKFTGTENHAWNEVLADGKWILEDTTWDAGGVDESGKFIFMPQGRYFDPDPKVFALDHRAH